MKDLRCVSLYFYFKIIDSDMFGGEGTVGYVSAVNHEAIGSKDKPFDDMVSIEGFNGLSDAYRKLVSGQMKVPVDNIIPISRNEFSKNTEEDED